MSTDQDINPPVSEIAFAVQFPKVAPIGVAEAGSFMDRFKPSFPIYQQAARIPSTPAPVLPPDGVVPTPILGHFQIQANFAVNLQDAALPRLLLVNSDSKKLLQFQDDRFGFNWRRIVPLSEPSHYPGFVALEAEFFDRYEEFSEWCSTQFDHLPEPAVAELTYINQVPLDFDGKRRRLSEVFTFFTPSRIKPIAGFTANWLERIAGDTPGTMSVNNLVTLAADGTPIVQSNYAARVALDEVKNNPSRWFAACHSAVLEVFAASIRHPAKAIAS